MSEAVQPLLSVRGIRKGFGGSPVLTGVDFDLYPGEVHVLLGENGAGKSTLTRILSGVYLPDSGRILRQGAPVTFASPAIAQESGIALLHQEPLVFPDLNVAENIFLGNQPRKGFLRQIDWKEVYAQAEARLADIGVSLNPRTPMKGLSVANQQMVELARALSQDAKVLILDEPTASLTPSEVGDLFRIMRRLREKGTALLFISHRLDEVFAIGDRITVLRDGDMVATVKPQDTTRDEIIKMMVGRSLATLFDKEQAKLGDVRLRVQNLTLAGKFRNISFEVRAGEIVGMAGLVGAGRTEVATAIFGVAPAESGTIEVDGQPATIRNPQQALKLGLAYVPEDRQKHGLLLPAPIAHNVTLPQLRAFSKMGFVDRKREASAATEITTRLKLRGSRGVQQAVGELSGGNQQKVSLSKWLLTQPKVLILDEPTRGLDVGAKAEVHRLMTELAQQGMAILMISSDLPEVLAMSDRVLVLREGRLTGTYSHEEATQEKIMTSATQSFEEATL